MKQRPSFGERVEAKLPRISPAERRVAHFLRDNPAEVLVSSAAALAALAGTSDATVVRTAKALGFAGLEELRRALASELGEYLSPATRLARSLREVGDDMGAAFDATLAIHRQAIECLHRDITPEQFRAAVEAMIGAGRVVVFGIGPSSAMAGYLAFQLARFGIDTLALTQTGLLLADDLQRLRQGDVLVMFAYGRVYRELAVLLDEADRRGIDKLLISDTLGARLRDRIDLVLAVARGRAEMFSMHTATLALIEALLVGVAARRPEAALGNLKILNERRRELAGEPMDLVASEADRDAP